jgi:prolipoprotein diacylglyceryl transferase
MNPLYIPSPDNGVWYLGPVPIRAYALCIITGVFAAIWLANRRWVARGGTSGEIADMAIVVVPAGLVGSRIYHVLTDHELYFGPGRNPIDALKIWEGGLGIWGAIIGGALAGMVWGYYKKINLRCLADAVAPALLLAQAIGRWGNYFNQELFGKPTSLPWGLKIDEMHRPFGYEADKTFHPTFLYESLWNLGVMGLLIWLDKRFKLGHGRVFALYVMGYTLGRAWVENLRIDPIELGDVGGLRFGIWVSIVLFLAALLYFIWASRTFTGREPAYKADHQTSPDQATDESSTRDDVEKSQGEKVHDREHDQGNKPQT